MFPVLDFSQGSDFYIISKLYTSTQTLNFINAKNIGQHGSIIIYFEDVREQGEAGGEFSNPTILLGVVDGLLQLKVLII